MNKLDLQKSKVLKKYIQKTINPVYKNVYVSEKMVITDGYFLLILNGVSSEKPVLIDFFTSEVLEDVSEYPKWQYVSELIDKEITFITQINYGFIDSLSEVLSKLKLEYNANEVAKFELIDNKIFFTKFANEKFFVSLKEPILVCDCELDDVNNEIFPLYLQIGFLSLLYELDKLNLFTIEKIAFTKKEGAIKFISFTNNVLYLMPMRVSEMDF